MVNFADEQTQCRRVQLMGHFGEAFPPELCQGAMLPNPNIYIWHIRS